MPEAPAETYGEAVAAAIGFEPGRVFKTLIAEIDGKPIVAIVPVSRSLRLKALASARSGKRAVMADPADAERLTGYVTGGISPFGQRKRLCDGDGLGDDLRQRGAAWTATGGRSRRSGCTPGSDRGLDQRLITGWLLEGDEVDGWCEVEDFGRGGHWEVFVVWGLVYPTGGLITGWLLEGDEVDGWCQVEDFGRGGHWEVFVVEVLPAPPEPP